MVSFCEQPLQCSDQFNFFVTRVPTLDEAYKLDIGIAHDQLHPEYSYTSELDMRLVYDRALTVSESPVSRGYTLVRWSPAGLDHIDRCVFASLTRDHRLSVYSRGHKRNDWAEVFRLSDLQCEYMASQNYYWESKKEQKAAKYQHCKYTVTTTEFCWSPHMCVSSEKKYGQLATATLGGYVIFWQIDAPVHDGGMHIKHAVQIPDNAVVSSLCWCVNQHNEGQLAVGCVNGCLYTINLQDYSLTQIWMEQDHIKISDIVWINELNVLVCSKGPYLLVLKCDHSDNLSDTQPAGVQCISSKLPIIGLCKGGDQVYAVLGDSSVQVGQVDTTTNTAASMRLEKLDIKHVDKKKMSCHGLVVSPNNMFIAILQSPWEMYCHLRLKDPLKLNIICVSHLDRVNTVLESSNLDPVYKKADAVLCLKYNQSVVQSWSDLPDDLKNLSLNITTHQLQILRCRLQLKLHMTPRTAAQEKQALCSAVDGVCEKILVHHLTNTLTALPKTSFKQFSHLEIVSVCEQCRLLKRLGKGERSTQDLVDSVTRRLPKLSEDTTQMCPICQCHSNNVELLSSSCPNGHKFARCAQTLLLCHEMPYRVCIWCGVPYSRQIPECQSSWMKDIQTNHCTLCSHTLVDCQ